MLEYTVSVLCRVVKDAALGMEDKVGSERENKKDEGDDAQKDKAAEEKELKKTYQIRAKANGMPRYPLLLIVHDGSWRKGKERQTMHPGGMGRNKNSAMKRKEGCMQNGTAHTIVRPRRKARGWGWWIQNCPALGD